MKKILLMLSVLTVQYSYGQFFRSHSFGKGDCTLSIKTMSSTGQTLEVAVNNTGGKKIVSVGLLEGNNSNMTIPAYNWNSSSSRSYNTGETVTFTDSWTFAPASSHYIRGFFITPIDTIYGNTIYFTVPGNTYPPSVEIIAISNITSNSASSGGNYLTDGGSSITAKGVVWDLDGNPLIALDPHTSNGTGTSNFTSSITGLNPNTLYYIRAYATNAYGTSYSGRLSFTTLASGTTPIVVTNAISSITENSAVSGGVITFDGNATIIEKGLCYKIGSTPISTDNAINSGSGSASWVTNITGLSPNTEYHVRAWARNSYVVNGFTVMALGYGQEEIFTTLPSTAILPTLATISASPIQSTYAFSGGTITGAGTNLITDRGVCYGTSTNPTISNSFVSSGVGQTGSYTTYLSPLSPSTLYYARAYATTIDGTAYGNQISFTTTASTPSCTVPVLATNSITSITTNSATSGGVISSDGGCSITAKGTQWSLDSNFSTIAGSTSDGTGSGNFTSIITGLNENTIYYVRSFATNSIGTGYGNTQSFTTSSISPCSLSVGDSYGGGKIAYFFQSGDPGYVSGECHGIIAASSDQSSGIQWYNGSYVNVSGLSSELNSGSSNTDIILYVQGYNYIDYAAGLARSYTGGGFSDWCLPSLNDLIKLYNNRSIIGGFSSSRYWASGQRFTSAIATMVDFSNGDYSQDYNKSFIYHVRAIRYF